MKTQKILNSASALSSGVIRPGLSLESENHHRRQGTEQQWGLEEDCAEPSGVGGPLKSDLNRVRQGHWLLRAVNL
jgi:hypothetical protein